MLFYHISTNKIKTRRQNMQIKFIYKRTIIFVTFFNHKMHQVYLICSKCNFKFRIIAFRWNATSCLHMLPRNGGHS